MKFNTRTSLPILVIAVMPFFAFTNYPTPAPTLEEMKRESQSAVEQLKTAELWMDGAVINDDGLQQDMAAPDLKAHYEIGSVSKSFTGILLAWTLEQNPEIHLEDPLSKFVPELKGKFAGAVTLRELATHTSGLPGSFCFDPKSTLPGACFRRTTPGEPWVDLDVADLLAFLNAYERSDAAPYARDYSNPGFVTLGYVLSLANHQSFDDLVSHVITGPLAMSDTLVNRSETIIPNFVQGHNLIHLPINHWHFNLTAPTGGIVSTPADMAKYLRANLNPPQDALGNAIQLSQKEGLGWDSFPQSSVVWKNGQTAGFSTMMSIDLHAHIGRVVMSNLACVHSAGAFPPYNLFGGVAPNLLGVKLSDELLDTYVGQYRSLLQAEPVLIQKPGVFLQLNTGDLNLDFRLSARSELEFSLLDSIHYLGYHKLTFNRDTQGHVSGFILHYRTGPTVVQDLEFTKVSGKDQGG